MGGKTDGGLVPFPIQLKTVVLESLHADRTSVVAQGMPPVPVPIGAVVKSQIADLRKASARLEVVIPRDSGDADGDANETFPFKLTCHVIGALEATQDTTEADFNAFIQQQAMWLLWPYMREIVHNMTVRMGLPPMIIPTIQVRNRTTGQDATTKA